MNPYPASQLSDAFPLIQLHDSCSQVGDAPLWRRLLWDGGGTPMDVFLTAASAQVGQVILNLPSESRQLLSVSRYCGQGVQRMVVALSGT